MAGSGSPQDLFDLFQKMLNPMAIPMQSLLASSLNVDELEKKITELRSVEQWLNANLALLQLSIKTLEFQRSVLAPSDNASASSTEASVENPFSNLALWPWNLMTAQPAPEEPAKQASAAKKKSTRAKQK